VMALSLGDDLLESEVGVIIGVEIRPPDELPKPRRIRSGRLASVGGRAPKAPGASTSTRSLRGGWAGTTEDSETGLPVRKAVYAPTEQEARAKLIKALAARQDRPSRS
jgi:hypothetical protein